MKLWHLFAGMIVAIVILTAIAIWAVNAAIDGFAERRDAWITECAQHEPRYQCEQKWRPWI